VRREVTAEKVGESRRVWDLPVRITHWAIVLSFVGAYASHRAGIEYFAIHRTCGYALLVLVTFRILWGVVGTRHARFASFLRGPRATCIYARGLIRGERPATPGHNPLGGLMIVFLLGALAMQAATGLFANDEIFNVGPLAGHVSAERSLALTSLHRTLFYWIAGGAALHVLAVAAHWLFWRENLVGPMLSGRKPSASVDSAEEITASRLWLALLLVATLTGLLWWSVANAPEVAVSGFE
jgi:cytochrome b